jgi:hypothetical protein
MVNENATATLYSALLGKDYDTSKSIISDIYRMRKCLPGIEGGEQPFFRSYLENGKFEFVGINSNCYDRILVSTSNKTLESLSEELNLQPFIFNWTRFSIPYLLENSGKPSDLGTMKGLIVGFPCSEPLRVCEDSPNRKVARFQAFTDAFNSVGSELETYVHSLIYGGYDPAVKEIEISFDGTVAVTGQGEGFVPEAIKDFAIVSALFGFTPVAISQLSSKEDDKGESNYADQWFIDMVSSRMQKK